MASAARLNIAQLKHARTMPGTVFVAGIFLYPRDSWEVVAWRFAKEAGLDLQLYAVRSPGPRTRTSWPTGFCAGCSPTTLADFDWRFQPSVPRGTIEQLATLSFLESGDNVIFVGSPGVGKSHPSIALGYEAVLAHKQAYFADCSKLVGDLVHAYAKEALSRRLRFYEHCSLLIIDELGYLDIGKEGADLLFQLVNRRYVLGRSTIVTTNAPVGRWGDVFGSNVTAGAIADRLCHRCALVKITGRSYRLKDVSIGEDDGKGGAS